MAKAGRKQTSIYTRLVQLTLPTQVDDALSNLAEAGFYGRSKSEVVVTLLSRELERIAKDSVVERLAQLART